MKKLNIKKKPIFFHNRDFKTILIRVYFPFKKDREYAKMDLLPIMLNHFNNKYPTEEEFLIEKQKLFIISSMCNYTSIGDLKFFTFDFSIPTKEVLNSDLYEKQFNFFRNVIYNPKIMNNAFYNNELDREKENLRIGIEKWFKMPNDYASIKSKEYVDDTGLLSDNIFSNIDQIDKVDGKNLYNYYLDKIYNNNPLVYIMGDVDKDLFISLAEKYLYNNNSCEKVINYEPYNYLLPESKINDITIDSDFNNSVVIYYYKVKDMTSDDEIYLYTINQLLSSFSSRLLDKELRDKNDLVYSNYSIYNPEFGYLKILASINKNNIDLVKKSIESVINSLQNSSFINPLLQKIKDRFRIDLIKALDSNKLIFGNKIVKSMKTDLTDQEVYDRLCKVTADDISSFMDRLILDTIYYLKEGEHE